MGKKNKVNELFNVPSNDEISGLSSLSTALSIINEAGAVSDPDEFEPKKFIVQKKEESKELASLDFYEKVDAELDEIAEQADSAFQEMMDIALNTTGKAAGDIANAARSFLETKMATKTAKLEKKFKMLNMQLAQRKQDFIEQTKKSGAITNEAPDDNDITTTNNNKEDETVVFDRSKFY